MRRQFVVRGWLQTRQLPYLLAVKAAEPLRPASGPPTPGARLAENVPSALAAPQRRHEAEGRRWNARRAGDARHRRAQPVRRWLLLHRSLRTGELAY